MKKDLTKNCPIQCLTQDGIGLSHAAQVLALCTAGAKWVQLRCKGATDSEVEKVARACLPLCRSHGARLIINDRIELARRIGADGVHLGKLDMPWAEARALVGDDFIIGGTVNSVADAEVAVASGALDYVGVGPYRYTTTKQKLASVLSLDQWQEIVSVLGPLPSYGIGGIQVGDLAHLRSLGLSGIAVCSGLFLNHEVSRNYQHYLGAWCADFARLKG